MGQIIEINQTINDKLLETLKNDPKIKSFSYSSSGAEVELKDEYTEEDADDFIDSFKKNQIKKKTPPGPP